MPTKRKMTRAEFLAKNLEEKILIERILLDRLNVIVSQNDTISTIYHQIKNELEGYREVRADMREFIRQGKKFKRHLAQHKRARRK